MARPLSEEKRDAILVAATDLVASVGVGAATAQIAKHARIADGTLFTYFPTKDDLLNQLYLHLKADLAEAMLSDYPSQASAIEQFRHVWNQRITWGADNPEGHRALRQLAVSDRISRSTRDKANAAFRDISSMIAANLDKELLAAGSVAFVGAVLEAIAEATLDFIKAAPAKRHAYMDAGFQTLWKGVGR
jgi:AcrR family transcriptional regulator